MAEPVTYKQPRKLNWVVAVILLALVAGGYAVWIFVPIAMRKGEVMRVLDETSSKFTGKSGYMLSNDKAIDKLLREMRSDIQLVGVEDPEAEYWIEIDDDNQVRFGVLYSDWLKLPWGEPREKVVELQMLCARQGRGTAWTCEGQDLQSDEHAEP